SVLHPTTVVGLTRRIIDEPGSHDADREAVAMTMLDNLIRGLVSTTLPLSLLGCGSGQNCDTPRSLPVTANSGCPGNFCNCGAGAVYEVCGSPPRTDAGAFACSDVPPIGITPPDCPHDYCQQVCAGPGEACWIISTDGGMTQVGCGAMVCTGRRPEGLLPVEVRSRSVLGRYAARAAHLEAASVSAFERLRVELRAFGAP